MDPLQATIDNIRAMELQLYMMRQLPKRTLIGEVTLQGQISKALQSLIPYGYLTAAEAERQLAIMREKGVGDAEGDEGIQIFLTSQDNAVSAEISMGKHKVSTFPENPNIETNTIGAPESTSTGATAFVPDANIPEELRGMHYADRVDIEAGIAVYQTEDGEIKDLSKTSSSTIGSVMSSNGPSHA
jgi:hypothetical protein